MHATIAGIIEYWPDIRHCMSDGGRRLAPREVADECVRLIKGGSVDTWERGDATPEQLERLRSIAAKHRDVYPTVCVPVLAALREVAPDHTGDDA